MSVLIQSRRAAVLMRCVDWRGLRAPTSLHFASHLANLALRKQLCGSLCNYASCYMRLVTSNVANVGKSAGDSIIGPL